MTYFIQTFGCPAFVHVQYEVYILAAEIFTSTDKQVITS